MEIQRGLFCRKKWFWKVGGGGGGGSVIWGSFIRGSAILTMAVLSPSPSLSVILQDVFHVQIMDGSITWNLKEQLPYIGRWTCQHLCLTFIYMRPFAHLIFLIYWLIHKLIFTDSLVEGLILCLCINLILSLIRGTVCSFHWVVQWSWFARVNALCNFSCKKSQEVTASLSGQFLSRCCFMLCITMKVEPRIAKQYKCHHSCKNYQGKGTEGAKKGLCFFFADQKITSYGKKCILGNPIAWATNYCLLPDTSWLWASKNAFKVGHHLPLWRKYTPDVKAAKGLKQCWAKVKGVNNPAWTAQ